MTTLTPYRNEWNILTKEAKAFPPKGFVRAAHAANTSGNVYDIAESPQEFAHLMQSPEWTIAPSDQEHVNLISADGITMNVLFVLKKATQPNAREQMAQ